MSYRINQLNNHPLQLMNQRKNLVNQESSFKAVLENFNHHDLKISKHAQARLTERNINISTEDWNSIELKVQEARQKGVHDSLVLVNDVALIVSAKNNTVITAMNLDEAKSQIFTNINGTIILD